MLHKAHTDCHGFFIRTMTWRKLSEKYPTFFLELDKKCYVQYIYKIWSKIFATKKKMSEEYKRRMGYNSQVIAMQDEPIDQVIKTIEKRAMCLMELQMLGQGNFQIAECYDKIMELDKRVDMLSRMQGNITDKVRQASEPIHGINKIIMMQSNLIREQNLQLQRQTRKVEIHQYSEEDSSSLADDEDNQITWDIEDQDIKEVNEDIENEEKKELKNDHLDTLRPKTSSKMVTVRNFHFFSKPSCFEASY